MHHLLNMVPEQPMIPAGCGGGRTGGQAFLAGALCARVQFRAGVGGLAGVAPAHLFPPVHDAVAGAGVLLHCVDPGVLALQPGVSLPLPQQTALAPGTRNAPSALLL